MDATTEITPRAASALVCHRESLLAAAAAAVIEQRHVARKVTTTTTLTETLTGLVSGVDVAVVFDGADEDVAELFEAIRHRGVRTPVVVVSDSTDSDYAARVLESGAAGIVPAECATEDLCAALVNVQHGHVVIAGDLQGPVLESLRAHRVERRDAQARLAALAPADLGILQLLCGGLTVSRIASRMSMSPFTVRGHIRGIGKQLGVSGQLRIAAAGRRLLAAAPPTAYARHRPARTEAIPRQPIRSAIGVTQTTVAR